MARATAKATLKGFPWHGLEAAVRILARRHGVAYEITSSGTLRREISYQVSGEVLQVEAFAAAMRRSVDNHNILS
jgi:hypothetical protein